MSLYSGLATPVLGYASKLEHLWAMQFRKWKWPAVYIGDSCSYADFLIDDCHHIEIKPEGDEFVRRAFFRSHDIIVIEGRPGWERWWVLGADGNAYSHYSYRPRTVEVVTPLELVEGEKPESEHRFLINMSEIRTPHVEYRTESIGELLARIESTH